MKILITGANGFVGKNLAETLKAIRDRKDKTRNILIEDVFYLILIVHRRSLRNIQSSVILL